MKPSTSIFRISPNFVRNLVVLSIPIGACRYGLPSTSANPLPNSLYITIFASAFTSFDISDMWAPIGMTMFTSAPIPSTSRLISAKSDGILKVPYIGPKIFTLGLEFSSLFASFGILPFVIPKFVKSHVIDLSAACHWSSSIVLGRNL